MPENTVEIQIRAKDQFAKAFGSADKSLDQLAKRADKVGKSLTLGLTMPIVGLGVAAVKSASELDSQMRNIQSVSKQTDAQIDRLAASFVDMSADITKTTDSADGLAAGFYDIQGSGFAGADAMEVLEASTKAASAGLTGTDVASKALTATLNAYGKGAGEAAHTADILFRTVDIGVGSFEELAGSVGGVVGSAAQAGVKFEELAAGLATMSKAGISFAEGATSMNRLILGIIKPSENLAEALSRAGYASGQAALDARGLAGVLELLVEQTGGGTEAMSELFPNVQSVRAALSLTRGEMEPFNKDLAAMADAAGVTEQAFSEQMKSMSAQMDNLKNTLNAALIPAGTTLIREVLIPAAKAITPIVKGVADLDPKVFELGLKFAGVAAVIGPSIVMTGKLITVYQTLRRLLVKVAVKAGEKTTAMIDQKSAEIAAVGSATKLATVLSTLASVLGPLSAGLITLHLFTRDQEEVTRRLTETLEHSNETYEEYSARIDRANRNLNMAARTTSAAIKSQKESAAVVKMSREEWEQLQDATEKLIPPVTRLQSLTETNTFALTSWARSTGEVTEAIKADEVALASWMAKQRDSGAALETLGYSLDEYTSGLELRGFSLRSLEEQEELFTEALERQKQAFEDNTKATEEAERVLTQLAEAYGRTMSGIYGGWQDLADRTAEAHEKLGDTLESLREKETEALAAAYAKRVAAVEGANEDILEAEEKLAKAKTERSRQTWAENLAELQANLGAELGAIQSTYGQGTAAIRAEYAERRAIAEQAHQEELARIKQAQQDQLLAATLGLAEQRGLLEQHYGDYGDTAAEALQGIQAGWLQITPEVEGMLERLGKEITGQFDTIDENLVTNAQSIETAFDEVLGGSLMTTEEVATEAGRRIAAEQDSVARETERVLGKLTALEEETAQELKTSSEEAAAAAMAAFREMHREGSAEILLLKENIQSMEPTAETAASSMCDSMGRYLSSVSAADEHVENLQVRIDALRGKDIYVHVYTIHHDPTTEPQSPVLQFEKMLAHAAEFARRTPLTVDVLTSSGIFDEALGETIMTTEEVAAQAASRVQAAQDSAARETERVLGKLAALEEETAGTLETSSEEAAAAAMAAFRALHREGSAEILLLNTNIQSMEPAAETAASSMSDSMGHFQQSVSASQDHVDNLQVRIDALRGKDIYVHVHTIHHDPTTEPQSPTLQFEKMLAHAAEFARRTPLTVDVLTSAVQGLTAGAGGAYLPALAGGGGRGGAGASPVIVLAPIFLSQDEFQQPGGQWDYDALARVLLDVAPF